MTSEDFGDGPLGVLGDEGDEEDNEMGRQSDKETVRGEAEGRGRDNQMGGQSDRETVRTTLVLPSPCLIV